MEIPRNQAGLMCRVCFVILVSVVALMPGDSSGLIVYRFGGESVPPPPEAGREGVEFAQRRWIEVDVSEGGETFELDMDDTGIRALKYDPQVNMAPTAKERGGGVLREEVSGEAFDGDPSTAWLDDGFLCAEVRFVSWCVDGYSWVSTININLGGFFLIDRIRVVSGLGAPERTARNYRISISPNRGPEGQTFGPLLPYFLEIRDNRAPFREIPFPSHQKVTFLQLAMAEHRDLWEVAEVEVYAKGFVDRSSYVSNILDFGGPAAWGELSWSGRQDPGAKVFIQTRSGADDDPNRYWRYTGRGDEKVEVTRSTYDKIKFGEKAGTTYDQDNWTFWSAPYDFTDSVGTGVASLSPRRFLQFKVDFFPQGDSGGELEFLELRASIPPAASELVGEIDPFQAEAGEVSRFTYALKPTLKGDDTGFDRLTMTTSSSRILAVDSVRIDNEAVPFTEESLAGHRFEVSFPRLEQEDSKTLVEVVFDAQVLRFASTFNAWVFDSTRPLEVPQKVSPGDATDKFDGNQVSVATSVGVRSLLEVRVAPAAFTPNGDGVNDVTEVSYDLLEITGFGAVRVEIRDLAGRVVRELYDGLDAIGHYPLEWDGTDASGEVVAPGVYLCRVSVDTDEEKVNRIVVVHVVY